MSTQNELSPGRRDALDMSPAVREALKNLITPRTLTKECDRFDMGVEFQKQEIRQGLKALFQGSDLLS